MHLSRQRAVPRLARRRATTVSVLASNLSTLLGPPAQPPRDRPSGLRLATRQDVRVGINFNQVPQPKKNGPGRQSSTLAIRPTRTLPLGFILWNGPSRSRFASKSDATLASSPTPALHCSMGNRWRNMNTKGKVFLLESPNALDLLEERGERSALEKVCKIFGYNVTSFLLRDAKELKQTLMYLSSITRVRYGDTDPLFIHISVHGDSDGILVGSDDVSWKELANIVSKSYENLDNYDDAIILILSACGSNRQKLTKLLTKKNKKEKVFNPPEYVFVFANKIVDWNDAIVTWTIFYREAKSLEFLSDNVNHIKKIQSLLRRLRNAGFGTLTYFRWDDTKYKKFTA